jgi:predicted nucleotidyltransferase component of viral defense system
MIENIRKHAQARGISLQDALQVFMQVVSLKNIHMDNIALIGGTSLVMGAGNPRFSEDIDLTGVLEPLKLKPYLEKTANELEAFLDAKVAVKPPKEGRATWKISCVLAEGFTTRLHVDSQRCKPLSKKHLMVEFMGMAPFVFPSVEITEIMADKLVALATRKNISGRDIFDLWYHWFKQAEDAGISEKVRKFLEQKLEQRKIDRTDFDKLIVSRLKDAIPERVTDEWGRYLPSGLKRKELYREIYDGVKSSLLKMFL